jgi:hypothetical protein
MINLVWRLEACLPPLEVILEPQQRLMKHGNVSDIQTQHVGSRDAGGCRPSQDVGDVEVGRSRIRQSAVLFHLTRAQSIDFTHTSRHTYALPISKQPLHVPISSVAGGLAMAIAAVGCWS